MDWPAGLPYFRIEPYQIAPQSAVLETDFGRNIRRRQIYPVELEGISVELILSASQERRLRKFYEQDTEQGTLPFDAPILANGVVDTWAVSFDGEWPTFTPVAPGHVRAIARLLSFSSFSTP